MFSQEKQQQFFQAALIIVGMTCLLSSPRQSGGAQASNAINTANNCPQDLRIVQVSSDSMLNLRNKPNGDVRLQLSAGEAVYVEGYDRTGAWAKVSLTSNDSTRGWVSNQYLGAKPGCPTSVG